MGHILLVRHGQASFGQSNYDALSDKGHEQSRRLSEYFIANEITADQIITGDLVRHRETASHWLKAKPELKALHQVDPRWNEFDFQAILAAYMQSDLADKTFVPQSPKDYFKLLRQGMYYWKRDQLGPDLPETWDQFHDRVAGALNDIQQSDAQTVCVFTSGGAIAMALSQIMRFDEETLFDVNVQTYNTGVTRCYFNAHKIFLTTFNSTSHIEGPENTELMTSL